jgi:Ca-activated chloride channel family protein
MARTVLQSNHHFPFGAPAGGALLVRRFLRRRVKSFIAGVMLFALIVAGWFTLGGHSAVCLPTPFKILAGSGLSTFEPILKRFGEKHCADIQMTYKGSLDIMMMLETGNLQYDAIWDADSLWVTIGDTHHLIKNRESIMRSPVVFGVKRSIAEKLGWIGKSVSVKDILTAAKNEKLRLMMTSATQSNSGASAYFGFLYAFARPNSVLTADNLRDPAVRDSVKEILKSINRTSESSGWLRDLFAKDYDRYDGMFNYESHIIELNQNLVKSHRELLQVIYPTPGLGVADFPFSYLDRGDQKKSDIFAKLQEFLLSTPVQKELAAKGRRVGPVGTTPGTVDLAVFNPDWGVDVSRILTPLRLPSTEVIRDALLLYQTVLRKPSFTVFILDFSGSMSGQGETQLKSAMHTLLDQSQAAKYLLQASSADQTVVVLFNDSILNIDSIADWTVRGNDPGQMQALLEKIDGQDPGAGTDMYMPAIWALNLLNANRGCECLPAIILMTDGRSGDNHADALRQTVQRLGHDTVPIYSITFGDADASQLQVLADLTHGRVFNGTKDLLSAFRQAKGNN